MERHCQKGHETMENEREIGQRQNGNIFAKPAVPHRKTVAKGVKITSYLPIAETEFAPAID